MFDNILYDRIRFIDYINFYNYYFISYDTAIYYAPCVILERNFSRFPQTHNTTFEEIS